MIALVVTTDGLPLAYEVMKGNTSDRTTLPGFLKKIEEQYGKEATKLMTFTRSMAGFNWSFKNEMEDIILVCDLYEKKCKKEKY